MGAAYQSKYYARITHSGTALDDHPRPLQHANMPNRPETIPMDNNQLLLTLRNALAMDNDDIAATFDLTGHQPDKAELAGMLSEREAADCTACSDQVMRFFLEGLILSERGPREDGVTPAIEDDVLSNNQILKKLRIAFNFKEMDMLSIFEEGGANLSVSEFKALFRKEENKHFRPCSDALLQQFLAGLTPTLDE